MTISQASGAVARVTSHRRLFDAVKARLQAERALQLELLEVPIPGHEHQATTGQGETDHVNVEMERQVVALLDAHAHQAVEDISAALTRIEDGTYGQCARCESHIDIERLLALPRVEFCVDCQRVSEVR